MQKWPSQPPGCDGQGMEGAQEGNLPLQRRKFYMQVSGRGDRLLKRFGPD
jgi:hypothetical protein